MIQYLATKYNVPAHKIYVIGLGKDKPVESNKTSKGRADNRRVDVRLMTNTVGGNHAQPTADRHQQSAERCNNKFTLLPGGLRQPGRSKPPPERPAFFQNKRGEHALVRELLRRRAAIFNCRQIFPIKPSCTKRPPGAPIVLIDVER